MGSKCRMRIYFRIKYLNIGTDIINFTKYLYQAEFID